MPSQLVKVKQNINGEISKYSGWGGFVADCNYTDAQGWCYAVAIAPPPNFDELAEIIWLPDSILVFLENMQMPANKTESTT